MSRCVGEAAERLLGEGGVGAAVAELLFEEAFGEGDGYVGDVALGVVNGGVDGVDEAFVGGDVEGGVTAEDFFVELLVDTHGVGLD